ncbi:MAG TPA: isoprenylcysteine carboxylmethyltransferase family protein [Vicinamibacterales bacterium]|nr:isoprenylcysteine carboxylmethyltransferase family protein [Vicinamibacterales bacterium]
MTHATVVAGVVAVILGVTLAEARVSRANERALLARGARGPRGDLFALVAVLYPVLLIGMGLEGLQRPVRASVPNEPAPAWFLSGALLFAASKALKYWAIAALGARWTFRILVVPGAPPVRTGPYRFVAHPNFIAVIGELAGAAMMCGALITGTAGVGVYSLVLWRRARIEQQALKEYA